MSFFGPKMNGHLRPFQGATNSVMKHIFHQFCTHGTFLSTLEAASLIIGQLKDLLAYGNIDICIPYLINYCVMSPNLGQGYFSLVILWQEHFTFVNLKRGRFSQEVFRHNYSSLIF